MGSSPMRTADVEEDKSHPEDKGQQQSEVRFRFPSQLIAKPDFETIYPI